MLKAITEAAIKLKRQKTNKNPSRDLAARYRRAQKLDPMDGAEPLTFNTTLYPHWIGDSDCFWYKREDSTGHCYRLVDAKTGVNKSAFDHQMLAKVLSEKTGKTIDENKLPLADIHINLSPVRVSFNADEQHWLYHDSTSEFESIDVYPDDWLVSPDTKKALFIRDYNLWVIDLATKEEKALTDDGERFYAYAGRSAAGGADPASVIEAQWSPDSKRVFTQVIDSRSIAVKPALVQYVPSDGSLRPKQDSDNGRMGFPGEAHTETCRFLAINVENSRITFSDHEPSSTVYPNYFGEFTSFKAWWDTDNRHSYFIHQQGKTLHLVRFDTHTGKVQNWITEHLDTCVRLIPISHLGALIYPLPKQDELIWYSERSGWYHLYLYDLSNGRLKHAITTGDWLVRGVLHVDEKRRELLIQTAGRVAGRNPYYQDICRVNIDTGDLNEVISTDHDYVVLGQRSCKDTSASGKIFQFDVSLKGVSPNGDYVVTTRSRVDQVPVSLLLDREGQELLTVETADVSKLPKNWQWPEPVKLTSADGSTDIWATVYRPSDFSPDRSYPVLDCAYCFSSSVGSFTNYPSADWNYLSRAAYAELGFIVVDIDNRGNNGLRSRAFKDYVDPAFPINPLPQHRCNSSDKVAGIKQLAKRYSYMDLERVGVVDIGSFPMALTGMLVHSNFYKVGVSHNAIAHSRMVGSCCFYGPVEEGAQWPELEDYAENLQGKLLLIAGMMDVFVPVANTLRIADALQKANKRFDMLLLPNLGHSVSTTGYVKQRAWDYFVEHLLGLEPPRAETYTEDPATTQYHD